MYSRTLQDSLRTSPSSRNSCDTTVWELLRTNTQQPSSAIAVGVTLILVVAACTTTSPESEEAVMFASTYRRLLGGRAFAPPIRETSVRTSPFRGNILPTRKSGAAFSLYGSAAAGRGYRSAVRLAASVVVPYGGQPGTRAAEGSYLTSESLGRHVRAKGSYRAY